ncbi:hypothetical protein RW64_11910 [Geobacter sulfurreducens]|nr:hypothetical protein RW64_11910 [Geobacter sulfurreducens]
MNEVLANVSYVIRMPHVSNDSGDQYQFKVARRVFLYLDSVQEDFEILLFDIDCSHCVFAFQL